METMQCKVEIQVEEEDPLQVMGVVNSLKRLDFEKVRSLSDHVYADCLFEVRNSETQVDEIGRTVPNVDKIKTRIVNTFNDYLADLGFTIEAIGVLEIGYLTYSNLTE